MGDKAGLLQCTVRHYSAEPRHGEIVPVRGEFAAQSAVEWGAILYPRATVTATTNGGSLDRGAGAAASFVWAYHVVAWSATGGNARWQLIVQTDDNTDFTTAATLETVNITATASGRAVKP